MRFTFKHTIYASYLGYITQAIVVNLAPLLFATFQSQFGISLERIGLIISVNFGVQILVDLAAARFIDKTGYRIPVVAAHVFAATGLALMGVLPFVMNNAYAGLLIATVLMAVGGGLIEVLISPIVEASPGEEKAAAMSLLHSFYSWGQVGVVLLSTLYFVTAGHDAWRFLPIVWAVVPVFNIYLFSRVPLNVLAGEGGGRAPLGKLFSSGVFWVLLILMVSSGAAEQAMAQWSSLFAEIGLNVDKTVGDLLGPCAFAALMGVARLFYGVKGSRINLSAALLLSAGLCIFSYLTAVFAPWPLLSLVGCALCGLSVGIMWPGTLSLSARSYPQGGTAMFAILALAGDVGCSSGPGIVGWISSAVENGALGVIGGLFKTGEFTQAGLKSGLLFAIVFPALMLLGVIYLKRRSERL